MRIGAKYIKRGSPTLEVIKNDAGYHLQYGDRVIHHYQVGDIKGETLTRLFITIKKEVGYKSAYYETV